MGSPIHIDPSVKSAYIPPALPNLGYSISDTCTSRRPDFLRKISRRGTLANETKQKNDNATKTRLKSEQKTNEIPSEQCNRSSGCEKRGYAHEVQTDRIQIDSIRHRLETLSSRDKHW